MMKSVARLGAAVAVFALSAAGPAAAQENLEKGKTPAQLYASDCAICHKSPRGLVKRGGNSGLDNFLRAHYTASRESAAAIGAYLRSVDKEAPGKDEPAGRRKTKAAKPADTKPSDKKSSDDGKAKPAAGADEAAKASAVKSDEKKSEPKPNDGKAETPGTKTPGAHDKPEKSDKAN